MASDLSKYLGNKVVRWFGGQAMPTAPAALYLALFNGDPKASGSEVTTSIRTGGRVGITLGSVPASGTVNTMTNTADSDFGASVSVSKVTVNYVAVMDAQSGGNILASKAVTSVDIDEGELVKALAGDLTFTFGS